MIGFLTLGLILKTSLAAHIILMKCFVLVQEMHLIGIIKFTRENTIFDICENKGADQLCRHCTADQCLCFRYMHSMIHLIVQSKISSF